MLSTGQKEIIKYCAQVRDIDFSVIPNASLIRLIDDLAMMAGVTNKRCQCQDCHHWKYRYCVSGMEAGRGICTMHSTKSGVEYYDSVAVGTYSDDESKTELQGNKRILTLGVFSCASFAPRAIDANS